MASLWGVVGKEMLLVVVLILVLLTFTMQKVSRTIEAREMDINAIIVKKNKVIAHFLSHFRDYKLNSLDSWFLNKIALLRNIEFSNLAFVKRLDAFCVFIWSVSSPSLTILVLLFSMDLSQGKKEVL